MYKYAVLIGKRFVSGLMDGAYSEEVIKFGTWKAADDYRQWCEKHRKNPVKPCVGVSEYIIDYAILEAI